MAGQFVVGLYDSYGIARDAHNRLHTEGVPWSETALRVLHETDPVPERVRAETAALAVSPLVWGDVETNFARFITNGETAVIVNAPTAADVDFAADILSLYDPIAVEVLTAPAVAAVK
ncbi:MAG TPA: hypothetical protein VG651_23975 [Stellaceae bacterium]|nr:hypothetical protein [Stellaceae bacterium]